MITKHELAIFNNLNAMSVNTGNILYGFAWSKSKAQDIYVDLHKAMIDLPELNIQDFLDHKFTPPTFFRSNDFIAPFQAIVDTYGVPSYKEVNPALFNIITFPFLFGVMFGDVGHGGILLVTAIALCLAADLPFMKEGPLKSVREARYMIVLMGFFSVFCGLLYNDFMSIPLQLFGGSCYNFLGNSSNHLKNDHPDNVFSLKPDCIYPVGVDWMWYQASNGLVFFNSMKMKIAVIFGVVQMCLGIFLKAVNAKYFKKPLDFFYEFIP